MEIVEVSKTKNLNEIVFVWGLDNYEYIKSLGFNCELVSDQSTQYGEDYLHNSDSYMLHKLVAIKTNRCGILQID
jgi:hypothetical protein